MNEVDTVDVLRETIVKLVRRPGPDLTSRQMGVLLTCYLHDGGHTVRGLAETLNVGKPVITRALDRLAEFDLARRRPDPNDRRSIFVQRTPQGTTFVRRLRSIMKEAAGETKKPSATKAPPTPE